MNTDFRGTAAQSVSVPPSREKVREALAVAEVSHLLEYKQLIDARLNSAKAVLQSQLAAIEKGTPVKAPRAPRQRMNIGEPTTERPAVVIEEAPAVPDAPAADRDGGF